MNKKEMLLYKKYWLKIKNEMETYNVRFNTWKNYVEIYKSIKDGSNDVNFLLLKISANLLSANVYVLYANEIEEYKNICDNILEDRVEYMKLNMEKSKVR